MYVPERGTYFELVFVDFDSRQPLTVVIQSNGHTKITLERPVSAVFAVSRKLDCTV